MNDWQPIDMAPKDGTLVLVYEPLNGVMIGYYRGQWVEATEAMPIEPTHWQSLPEPPCSTCGGTGIVIDYERDAEGEHRVDNPCPSCQEPSK